MTARSHDTAPRRRTADGRRAIAAIAATAAVTGLTLGLAPTSAQARPRNCERAHC